MPGVPASGLRPCLLALPQLAATVRLLLCSCTGGAAVLRCVQTSSSWAVRAKAPACSSPPSVASCQSRRWTKVRRQVGLHLGLLRCWFALTSFRAGLCLVCDTTCGSYWCPHRAAPPCPSTLFEGALPPLTDVLSVEGLQADLLFEDYFIRWGGRP